MKISILVLRKKSVPFLFFLFLICPLISPAQDFERKEIKVSSESNLNIHGDAKITGFTCKFKPDYLQQPGSIHYDSNDSKITFKNSSLVLRNKGFDCGKRSRNKDFHQMVRTEEYPEMKLTLNEVIIEDKRKAVANVDIWIAGKENTYNFAVDISQKSPRRIKGQLKINVLDFGLEPITKMLGLIKVDEMIDINIDLIILE
jgi:hypothetical protein